MGPLNDDPELWTREAAEASTAVPRILSSPWWAKRNAGPAGMCTYEDGIGLRGDKAQQARGTMGTWGPAGLHGTVLASLAMLGLMTKVPDLTYLCVSRNVYMTSVMCGATVP